MGYVSEHVLRGATKTGIKFGAMTARSIKNIATTKFGSSDRSLIERGAEYGTSIKNAATNLANRKFGKSQTSLVERFTNIPDKEIGTKYTKDLGIEWLRQLAYKSIAVADLLDKKDNDNNGDKKS